MPIFPVEDTSGNGYPITQPLGSGSPETISQRVFREVVNGTWAKASTAANAFDDIVTATTARIDEQNAADALTVNTANETPVVEPVITIPTSADVADIISTFDTKYLELVALLVEKFTTFQTTYFPNDSANYALAESWVADAINNPDHGIPAAVAAQLLTDVKSRAYADMAVQSDAVLTTFAARRFPLPPGAAASAVLQISQKAQDAIAMSSRELMMKYVEQMRFAIDKSLSMREQAMSSAIEYIKALASGPSLASGLVGIGYDAQSKLISSVASFYNARTDASRLVKQAEQFNVDRKFGKDEKNVSNDITLLQENVKLLMTEAQALAQIATSLFNNLNISTSVTA